jgi:hypothetical protein
MFIKEETEPRVRELQRGREFNAPLFERFSAGRLDCAGAHSLHIFVVMVTDEQKEPGKPIAFSGKSPRESKIHCLILSHMFKAE